MRKVGLYLILFYHSILFQRKLGSHVSLVHLLGITCTDDQLHLIFEAPGYGFLHRLLFQSRLSLKKMEIMSICRDLADALKYIHRKGLIHCAVTSFSVILGRALDAKVIIILFIDCIVFIWKIPKKIHVTWFLLKNIQKTWERKYIIYFCTSIFKLLIAPARGILLQ